MKKNNEITPIIGRVYKLTYMGKFYGHGIDIISEDFEFMCNRGPSSYYFFNNQKGIDLIIKKWQFKEYLENTKEKLLKQ
jgi:hypothetical protein